MAEGPNQPTPPSHERARGVVGGRHLSVAIVVGIGMAILFLGSLAWHPAAFTIVVALVMVAAHLECGRVLEDVGHPVQLPVLLVATLAMVGGTYRFGYLGLVAGVLVLVIGSMLWQLVRGPGTGVVRTLATTAFLGLWVPFLGSFAVLIVQRPGAGTPAVLAVIGAAILADIGGFAFGVAFGRHRLAPRVSPSKTWEGLIGGLLLATVAGATLLPLWSAFTLVTGALIAAACALASVVGDLIESMLKRDLGVKDLGGILPGHGGILDRVDGILLALPVGHFVLALVL